MIYCRSIFFSFCLLFSFALDAQKTLSANSEISLLTCSPGDEAYSTFGHTAIRVKDVAQGIDYAFHYGLFDFNDPNFMTKFLRGKLMYSMGAQDMDRFVRQYTAQKRTVYQQILNLDQVQKEAVYNFLLENYKPENREYLYDFFFYNCSTIVKDKFEIIFSGLQYPSEVKEITFRQMLDEHLTKMPWTDFGIDLIIGSIADRKASQSEQFFLPIYVHDYYAKTFIDGKPLVKDEKLMIDFIKEQNTNKNNYLTPWLVFSIFFAFELGLLIYFLTKAENKTWIQVYDKIWFFLLGIGGLILLFMWFGTDHDATKNNWNLLWLNPLYLLLLLPQKWLNPSIKKSLALFLLLISVVVGIGLISYFQDIHKASYLIIGGMIFKLFRYQKYVDDKFNSEAKT